MNDRSSRRRFLQKSTALTASALAGGVTASAQDAKAAPPAPHPVLTPAEDFETVARGNPKPHSLRGEALVKARLAPETWRLEITADPKVEPPHVRQPAELDRPLTIEGGNALDLPRLIALGREHGVKFIKAMQCLNIATPLGQGLWEGVPLRDVLRLCGRMNNVRRIYYRGFHNNDPGQIFQSSLSYTQVMETPPGELPVFLAFKLNGEPIPLIRGGPVRMIVPWAHGFKSIKWLQQIFVTNDHRINDTYALQNNDPDSALKTAAYVDDGPKEVARGEPVVLTGLVISGLSGVKRVEYWVREVGTDAGRLADDDPELLRGPWIPCEITPPPEWDEVLPPGLRPHDILGFDRTTGQPLTWPLRYGMASYSAVIRGLKPGIYELRSRAVDLNGFAQPEPRAQRKAGKNNIQVRSVTVI
ncbi:MAG: molybdopterin-dependent oxidoreductase [Akkermansiaceae bacterium]|nr:molybdopterin-dependent oxidoreductase [Akkermansiaceae bacterium]